MPSLFLISKNKGVTGQLLQYSMYALLKLLINSPATVKANANIYNRTDGYIRNV